MKSKILKLYLYVSGALVGLYIICSILTTSFHTTEIATHEVIGHAVRPSTLGDMHLIIVGEILEDPNYPKGVPVIYADILVKNSNEYQLGTKVTYQISQPLVWGNSWGFLIDENGKVLDDLWEKE